MSYGFGIIRFTVTVFIRLNAAGGSKTTNKRRPRINAASHQKNTAFTRGKQEKTRYNLAIYTIQTFTILSQPSSNNANFYPNVCSFDFNILSPPSSLGWPDQGRHSWFSLYYNNLHKPFNFHQTGLFGVIHNGSLLIWKCWAPYLK